MKEIGDVFSIAPDGTLEINKAEAREYPAIKDILQRDKGSKGDHDGRKKAHAFKELLYCYLIGHPNSMYRDLPKDAMKVKAKSHANLVPEWEEDALIVKGIKAIKEIVQLTSLHHSYINANKGVYALGEDLEFLNKLRNRTRDRLVEKEIQENNAVNEEDKQELSREVDALTSRLINLGTEINKIAAGLPTAFEKMEELKKQLIKEQGEAAPIYGGGKLGNREKV